MVYTRLKWLPLLLCLALIFSLFFPSGSVTTLANEGETITLKILHTNDIHANINDFGKIAAYLQSEREHTDYSLYLDAGDIFSGNPVVDLQQGAPMIDLLNHMGLQAMAIGNHEFDYGQEIFAKNEQDSSFHWLSANMSVVDTTIPIEQPDPFTIFNLGEITVGVLSLTEAPPSTAPSGVVGLEFDENYADVIGQYEFLRDEVDVLIGLTHIGYPDDRTLAQKIDFLDVIIGGHSHTTLNQPVVVNGTPIVQTGGNGTNVGNLTITLDGQTKEVQTVQGHLQSVADLVEVDEEVQAKVDQYNAEMEEVLGKVIGYTNTGLSREGSYSQDVPLGNFWTDAMRELIGADIAVTNNGGIRDSIAPGEITAGDIYRVEPFANEVMEFRMTGQAIKDVIEFSYTREGRNQIDLQSSGLHYEIITDATGNYIDSILEVNGQPIDLEATYSVAVPDYIGTGGSGYQFVGEVVQPSAGFMTNAMIAYAEQLMAERGAIDYTSEGRIKVTVDSSGGIPGEVIGYTEKGLSDANKTKMDASLGNLYTDAVRAKGQADIGLLNGSSVTGQIPAGDITDEQIKSLDQYNNEVVVVKTTGERIRDVILSQSNYYGAVDLQVSGLHYVLVEGNGEEKYSDVQLTLEGGASFDLTAEYTVAYNDYMHGRSFYNLGSETIGTDQGLVWEAVVDYVRQHEGPIDYVAGQRIQIEDLEPEAVMIAEARTLPAGTEVTIEGIATTNSGSWGAKGFYLQDETAGAYVFQNLENVNPGDVVQITGRTGEYNGEFQFSSLTGLEKVDTAPVPDPIEVTPHEVSKVNEGQLIILENVMIENIRKVNDFGTFEFDAIQGNEEVIVRVDNRTGLSYDDFTLQNGNIVDVTGISSQFRGTFQVKPRMADDIVLQDLNEPVTFDHLYEFIETVEFKNYGAKRSLIAHNRSAERHFAKAEAERERGKLKQAEHQLTLGMKALEKVKRELEKNNKGLSPEHKEELIRLVDLLITQYEG